MQALVHPAQRAQETEREHGAGVPAQQGHGCMVAGCHTFPNFRAHAAAARVEVRKRTAEERGAGRMLPDACPRWLRQTCRSMDPVLIYHSLA